VNIPLNERIAFDVYKTHSEVTQNLFRIWRPATPFSMNEDMTILEPCSGDGAMANIIQLAVPEARVLTNDIRIEVKCNAHLDATLISSWEHWRDNENVDWVITNPPFKHVPQILPLAYGFAGMGVAMLLRLTYLEPTSNRSGWLKENPPTGIFPISQPRPSFRTSKTGAKRTDSVGVAWMVWEKGVHTTTVDFITDWHTKEGDMGS